MLLPRLPLERRDGSGWRSCAPPCPTCTRGRMFPLWRTLLKWQCEPSAPLYHKCCLKRAAGLWGGQIRFCKTVKALSLCAFPQVNPCQFTQGNQGCSPCRSSLAFVACFPKQQESRDNRVEVMVQAEQAACVLLKWVRKQSSACQRDIVSVGKLCREGVRAPRWGHLKKQRIVRLRGPYSCFSFVWFCNPSPLPAQRRRGRRLPCHRLLWVSSCCCIQIDRGGWRAGFIVFWNSCLVEARQDQACFLVAPGNIEDPTDRELCYTFQRKEG